MFLLVPCGQKEPQEVDLCFEEGFVECLEGFEDFLDGLEEYFKDYELDEKLTKQKNCIYKPKIEKPMKVTKNNLKCKPIDQNLGLTSLSWLHH